MSEEKFYGEISDDEYIDEKGQEYTLKEMLRQAFASIKPYSNLDHYETKETFEIGGNEKCSTFVYIKPGDQENAKEIIEAHKVMKKLSKPF